MRIPKIRYIRSLYLRTWKSIGKANVNSNNLNAVYKLIFFLKFYLLGWQWLIKLHRFQVYNSVIHHLYIALCAHCPKSPYIWLPSPFTTPTPLPSGNHHTIVHFWVFVFLLYSFIVFLYPKYEWNHMVLNFFCLTYFA